MSYKSIAIDCSNLYWRSVCSLLRETIDIPIGDRKVSVYTKVVQDFIDRVNALKKEYLYDNGKVYLLFDNPKSTLELRKIIDEEYKSPRLNRTIPRAFWDTLKILKQVLLHYSDDFVFVQYDFCEADDLVVPLLDNIEINESNRLLLVSADMDWARGISKNVDWFNYKQIFNEKVFYKMYRFMPEKQNVILYKCFRGDASDNIEKGLPNLPEEMLLKMIENNNVTDCHSFRTFLHKLQNVDYLNEHWKLKVKYAEDLLLKNYQLISFIPVNASFENMIIPCKEYISVLKTYYTILQLPYEVKMMSKESIEDSFLQPREYTHRRKVFR